MAPAVGRVHRALLPEPTPAPVLEYADQKDQFATTNSTLWRQQRYAPRDNHYLWDACAGIGTVGDVCPQVLPCATPGCAIRKLPGLAYNPSVVRAPAWVVAAAARALPPTAPPVRYVASDRIGRNNIPVRCRNKAATNILFSPKEHRETRQHHKHAHTGAALVGDALLPHPHPNGTHASNRTVDLGSGSDLLLLDAALRVVVRAPIHGGACAQSPDALVDVRLFDAAGALYASYNTFGRAAWTRFIPGARVVPHGKDCKGHWVSRLELNFAKDGAHFSDRRPLHVNATPTERFGGSGLSGTPGEKLAAARNAGLLAASAAAHLVSVTNRSERHEELLADAFAKPNPLSALSTSAAAAAAPGLELVHFAPWTEWRVRGGGVVRRAAPTSFPEDLHNSIHPLWIPEMGAYLGVAHRHSKDGTGTTARAYERDGKPHPPFQFGYAYRHVFLLLSPQLRVTRYSREYCLPALDGGVGGPACEGVQFVVAAFRGAPAAATSKTLLPLGIGSHATMQQQEEQRPDGGGSDAITFSYSVMDCESAALTLSLARLDELLEFMNEQPDYSSNIDPPGVCVRPQRWCVHSTAVYDVAKDCDGDGIPDPYCSDDLGRKGILSSKNACTDTWPNGVCPPPPPPL